MGIKDTAEMPDKVDMGEGAAGLRTETGHATDGADQSSQQAATDKEYKALLAADAASGDCTLATYMRLREAGKDRARDPPKKAG